MSGVNLLLASAGRRPYLAKWFKEGLALNGLEGRVIVADVDPGAAAQVFADEFITAPRVDDCRYSDWLRRTLVDQAVTLAVSVNDFELSTWAQMPREDPVLSPLTRLISKLQAIVEDKLEMTETLTAAGISVPATATADDFKACSSGDLLVVKGRYGSGSRGLSLVDGTDWERAVERAMRDVTDRQGRMLEPGASNRDLVVVQSYVPGQEYGLDVVSDLDGEFVTVLARKKLAMRAGETDKAISVDAGPFFDLGRKIAQVTRHRGLIDVDVIVGEDEQAWVIDVNPRFGGGYPFSHAAGANIPAAYIAWISRIEPKADWLKAKPNVTAAKYVDIVATGTSP